MKRSFILSYFRTLPAILAAMILTASAAWADTIVTGDVSPTLDPSQWPEYAYGYIGNTGTGALSITGGSTMLFDGAYIGYESGADGTLEIDGDGSSLAISMVYAGYNGAGSLAVANGGLLEVTGSIDLGENSGSSGAMTVDGANSTGAVGASLHVGSNGTGALTVTNGGSVTVSKGFFTLGFGSAGSSGTAVVDGDGSAVTAETALITGYNGTGVLSITNGGSVASSKNGIIGNTGTSNGTVVVDGEGSSLAIGDTLTVGWMGTGALNITNGGSVSAASTVVGRISDSGGTGTALVNGDGASLATAGSFKVGGTDLSSDSQYTSVGRLAVTDGGLVTAGSLHVNNTSTVTVDTNSALKVGAEEDGWTGDISNEGAVRLVAGAGADAGVYTPISYGEMTGDGLVQALGGIWDETDHTITVAEAATAGGSGGAFTALDLSVNQRVIINDTDTGKSAGMGFVGADEFTLIAVNASATVAGEAEYASLETLIAGTGDSILSAWDFLAVGYDAGVENPVYLSLFAEGAVDLLDLTIWYLLNGEWAEFDAADLAFDGLYAGFTATELGTYAVTASAVPVPGAVWLLGSGLLGMIGLRRRKGCGAADERR